MAPVQPENALPSVGGSPRRGAADASRWADIGGGGERVDPRVRNDLFYAHLSLYRFALPYAKGGRVLDAGSGSGYGAAWLAERGARRVLGLDVDPEAVAFSRAHFASEDLDFRVMDVERIEGLPARAFDLVFSSNTLEHLADPWAFLRAAHGLLDDEGTLLIAVPAVFNIVSRVQQLSNPHHLVIWSPEQWFHAVGRYFEVVEGWCHLFARHDLPLDVHNGPADCRIDEGDFAFERLSEEDLRRDTLTNVFVARRPRPVHALPCPGAPPPPIDDSFVRARPRLTPLPLEEAALPVRPLAALPARAFLLLRERGPLGLLAEGRRYVLWRLRRRAALRLLGDRVREHIPTPRVGRQAGDRES